MPKVIAVVLALAALVLCVLNMGASTVSFWGAGASVPMAVPLFLTLALGFASSYLAFHQSIKQVQTDKKLQVWDAQDAKLALQVQSDKEKQLEAKIATLEAALKSALARKSS